jgi:hypothetical protein
MTPQDRRHAAIEYGRHEALHSRLADWDSPSPRAKIGIWLALSAALWVPIIALTLLLTQ